MTAITSHLSAAELEARYETAADPVSKSHFHTIWLLTLGYTSSEVAAIRPLALYEARRGRYHKLTLFAVATIPSAAGA